MDSETEKQRDIEAEQCDRQRQNNATGVCVVFIKVFS
jgi:hypothetical protein